MKKTLSSLYYFLSRKILLFAIIGFQMNAAAGWTQTVKQRQQNISLHWGFEYRHRLLFFPSDRWNGHLPQNTSLPRFSSPMTVHSFIAFVEKEGKIYYGCMISPGLSEIKAQIGFTKWESLILGCHIGIRKPILSCLEFDLGFSAGYGRFKVASVYNFLEEGIFAQCSAVYIEPFLGLNFFPFKPLFFCLYLSSFNDFNRHWTTEGGGIEDKVLPAGLTLSISAGIRFTEERNGKTKSIQMGR